MTVIQEASSVGRPFRHEALLYAATDEFVHAATRFVRDGLAAGDAVLVVVDAPKIDRLRRALAADADRVEFADMASVGRNPALIIQAWRDFADRRADGRAIRGIGEPISTERNDAALVECHIHESLLNVAFEHDADFWLLCPYDTGALAAPVLERAIGNHPFVCDHGGREVASTRSHDHDYDGHGHDGHGHAYRAGGFALPLPPAPGAVASVSFDLRTLRQLRAFVTAEAARAGIDEERVRDLAVAASEIATNSIRHGGGPGDVRAWTDGDYFVSEIRGAGTFTAPLVGRLRPEPGRPGGRGLWLANQFCDLVQLRSTDTTTTVRLHLRR